KSPSNIKTSKPPMIYTAASRNLRPGCCTCGLAASPVSSVSAMIMSAPARLTASVGSEDDGERLDRFLSRRFPEVSRARFQGVIANGGVAVEGAVVRQPRRKVKAGEQVEAELPL